MVWELLLTDISHLSECYIRIHFGILIPEVIHEYLKCCEWAPGSVRV